MFEVRRQLYVSTTTPTGYKIGIYSNPTTLASAISGNTVKVGDEVYYTWPGNQHRYAIVAADGSLTLTPQ